MQSVYSTVLADWAIVLWRKKILRDLNTLWIRFYLLRLFKMKMRSKLCAIHFILKPCTIRFVYKENIWECGA